MTNTELLLGIDKDELVRMVQQLVMQQGTIDDIIPMGYNLESDYKDALYAGMIDKDLEFESIAPDLSFVTIEDGLVYLNGDEVQFVPNYKSLKLVVKGFTITGLVKAEILGRMILDLPSLKIGSYMGWDKYLIQYKAHTLVLNTKGAIAGIKLLKYDYMAKKMYSRYFKSRPINNWREIDEDEKVFGSKDISMPNAVDQMEEEVYLAIETIERGSKYPQIINALEVSGWRYESESEIDRLNETIDDLNDEITNLQEELAS